MNCGLNSKAAFHTRAASIYSCSVTSLDRNQGKSLLYELQPSSDPTRILPHFGVFLLHHTAPVGVIESRDPKLFGRAIIFQVF